MNAIDHLLAVADAYASARGLSESRVSTLAFGEGTRLGHVRRGGEMGARRVARGIAWFSENWPEGAEWPADVPRPALTEGAAA
jgi:hypothetical protein